MWCKTDIVDNRDELRYVEDLFAKAKGGVPTAELLEVVIAMCKKKILHRMKKLAKAFEVNMDEKEGNMSLPSRSSHQMLETVLQRQRENQTTTEVLDNFTRAVRTTTKSSSERKLLQILLFSWHVTAVRDLKLENILDWNVVRYLKKIGDYARIIDRFPALLKKLRGAKLTIRQVRTYN